MKLDSLEQLFVEQLQDLYSAETQIIEALPKMAKAASSADLQNAFKKHLEQTRAQAKRLEQIFEELDESASGEECEGMKGLLIEGEELIEEDSEPEVQDAALIAAAQRVEHYEIAAYGTARTYARLLGLKKPSALLQQTLDEEKQTDQLLNSIAERINVEAKAA